MKIPIIRSLKTLLTTVITTALLSCNLPKQSHNLEEKIDQLIIEKQTHPTKQDPEHKKEEKLTKLPYQIDLAYKNPLDEFNPKSKEIPLNLTLGYESVLSVPIVSLQARMTEDITASLRFTNFDWSKYKEHPLHTTDTTRRLASEGLSLQFNPVIGKNNVRLLMGVGYDLIQSESWTHVEVPSITKKFIQWDQHSRDNGDRVYGYIGVQIPVKNIDRFPLLPKKADLYLLLPINKVNIKEDATDSSDLDEGFGKKCRLSYEIGIVIPLD